MVTIKCHKCGRKHRKHTSLDLRFDATKQEYHWMTDPTAEQFPIVHVGQTCFESILIAYKNKPQ